MSADSSKKIDLVIRADAALIWPSSKTPEKQTYCQGQINRCHQGTGHYQGSIDGVMLEDTGPEALLRAEEKGELPIGTAYALTPNMLEFLLAQQFIAIVPNQGGLNFASNSANEKTLNRLFKYDRWSSGRGHTLNVIENLGTKSQITDYSTNGYSGRGSICTSSEMTINFDQKHAPIGEAQIKLSITISEFPPEKLKDFADTFLNLENYRWLPTDNFSGVSFTIEQLWINNIDCSRRLALGEESQERKTVEEDDSEVHSLLSDSSQALEIDLVLTCDTETMLGAVASRESLKQQNEKDNGRTDNSYALSEPEEISLYMNQGGFHSLSVDIISSLDLIHIPSGVGSTNPRMNVRKFDVTENSNGYIVTNDGILARPEETKGEDIQAYQGEGLDKTPAGSVDYARAKIFVPKDFKGKTYWRGQYRIAPFTGVIDEAFLTRFKPSVIADKLTPLIGEGARVSCRLRVVPEQLKNLAVEIPLLNGQERRALVPALSSRASKLRSFAKGALVASVFLILFVAVAGATHGLAPILWLGLTMMKTLVGGLAGTGSALAFLGIGGGVKTCLDHRSKKEALALPDEAANRSRPLDSLSYYFMTPLSRKSSESAEGVKTD